MRSLPRETLDIEALDRAVVRTRMWLHFHLFPKGDRDARRIFCLGGAKTGTSSLHALFRENGIRSLHSPGDWRLDRYEAFSDRGDFRPFAAYDHAFPAAVFILNTRGLHGYLASYATHLQRKLPEAERKPLPVQYFVNRILRRNRDIARVLVHFNGADRLLVVNIDRPGAMDFVARRLDLAPPSNAHRHKTRKPAQDVNEAPIAEAIARLGLTGLEDHPLIFQDLLPTGLRQAPTLPPEGNCWL